MSENTVISYFHFGKICLLPETKKDEPCSFKRGESDQP